MRHRVDELPEDGYFLGEDVLARASSLLLLAKLDEVLDEGPARDAVEDHVYIAGALVVVRGAKSHDVGMVAARQEEHLREGGTAIAAVSPGESSRPFHGDRLARRAVARGEHNPLHALADFVRPDVEGEVLLASSVAHDEIGDGIEVIVGIRQTLTHRAARPPARVDSKRCLAKLTCRVR